MRFHGHTKAPYLAMVLLFVLQHLLQIHATGQITLSQVVAELGDAEQTLLRAHCLTMIKQEHTRTHGKKKNSTPVTDTDLYLKQFRLYLC